MSEPVSNAEIEDVLSSIRRLVSEDVRPERSGENQSDENSRQTGDGDNRLVLTPAFRVSTPDKAKERSAERIPEEAEIPTPESAGDTEGNRETEAGPAPESANPKDHSEDISVVNADAPASVPAGSEDTGADENPAREPGIFEFEDADASDDRADGGASDPDTETGADSAPGWDDAGLETTQDQDSATGWRALERTIADLEAVVGAQSEDWEPDGSEEDTETPDRVPGFTKSPVENVASEEQEPVSSDEPPQFEHVAAETTAEDSTGHDKPQEAAPTPENAADPGSVFDDDASLLDEEALRDLVSEIVREELQGSLGERITRNVRKLVRREIHRALAARDFD